MSRRRITAVGGLSLLAAVWGGAGCDGTPSVSTSTEEVSVQGTVRISGKPAKQKQLAFDPTNVKRRDAPIARVTTGDDGSYRVKTLAGTNAVTIQGVMDVKQLDLHSGENTEDLDFSPKPGARVNRRPGRRPRH